ncbi:hypothetical protein [Kibdelosporangium philippinense]|uniref:hypothetical protein n=1 Tax=Kibdelosporangium philippinense TaxID=211113 RepID=UPI00361457BB
MTLPVPGQTPQSETYAAPSRKASPPGPVSAVVTIWCGPNRRQRWLWRAQPPV